MIFSSRLANAAQSVTRTNPLLPLRLLLWSLVLLLLARTHADPDLWGHVLFGRDIVRAGHIPRFDSYSFTTDIPWVNHEWLAEVLMYAAYWFGGSGGISLLRIALLLMSGTVLVCHLASLRLTVAAVDLWLAFAVGGTLAQTLTMRPQVFSVLLFAITIFMLLHHAGRPTIVAPLFMVMVWWVNLHGGWIVGAGAVLIWAVVAAVTARGPASPRIGAFLLTVTPVVGVLLNPYGTGMVAFVQRTVGFGRRDITEWQGVLASTQDVTLWVVLAGVAIVAGFRSRTKVAPSALVLTVLLGIASFRVARLTAFFALTVGFCMSQPNGTQRSEAVQGPRWPQDRSVPLLVWGGVLLGLVAALVAAATRARCIVIDGAWAPDQSAVLFMRQSALTGKVLTWFDWGEYAIWHLSPSLRVSMDGRRETVYSDEVIEGHDTAYFGKVGGMDYVSTLDADYAWLPLRLPLVEHLLRAGWREMFRTEASVVLAAPHHEGPISAATVPPSCSAGCFPGR